MKTDIKLSPAELEQLGKEFDAIQQRVLADLGERDANYIRRVVRAQRRLEIAGRGLLFASIFPPAWVAGVAALSAAKILDNMEIGHNVMHGQYDWMNDPQLSSQTYDWDNASPADQWRHSHNYMHHTYTNVQKIDRDLGYNVLRMSEEKRWRPRDLLNPITATGLAFLFQYGVAIHDLELDRMRRGQKSKGEVLKTLRGILKKVRRQSLKDYVVFPLLALPIAPLVFAGNLSANVVRNLWTYAIIFCGHFPDGVAQFDASVLENETRGQWYYRQLLGSANLSGGKLFHIMSGNLSHQIEHHLFPTLPAHRYAEISEEVKTICERYGLPYNSGPLHRQFGTVVRRIAKLSLPNRVFQRPALAAA